MTRLAPLILLAAACITPQRTHTTRRIAHVVGPRLRDPSVLTVRVAAGEIHVNVTRVCRAHAHDVVADTLHVTADLGGMSTLPRTAPDQPQTQDGGGALALVFLAVSGLATAVDIAAEDGRVEIRSERAPDESLPCPMALRGVPVAVELPSGRVLEGTTDDSGTVDLALPDGELGELTVRAPGMDPETAPVQ